MRSFFGIGEERTSHFHTNCRKASKQRMITLRFSIDLIPSLLQRGSRGMCLKTIVSAAGYVPAITASLSTAVTLTLQKVGKVPASVRLERPFLQGQEGVNLFADYDCYADRPRSHRQSAEVPGQHHYRDIYPSVRVEEYHYCRKCRPPFAHCNSNHKSGEEVTVVSEISEILNHSPTSPTSCARSYRHQLLARLRRYARD